MSGGNIYNKIMGEDDVIQLTDVNFKQKVLNVILEYPRYHKSS